MSTYRPVPAQVDLPAMERDILKLWRDRQVFETSTAAMEGNPRWVFYEGPPTANGMPGTHHVEARVFKDVFPRFKTMQGYYVERKAGWDCHGLPVEIAVEKELGFNGKPDIEAFGVAPFNDHCRTSVLRNVDAFETMTERMGFWVDTSQAYRTMDPDYVQSVWWSLKQIWDKGLLVSEHRVSPYCPRCGTTLSDHELGQPGGYETVVDPSVYVRFPVTGGPLAKAHPGVSLLVWTTTPWTLVSNTAVAVNSEVEYRVVRTGPDSAVPGELLVVAAPLVAAVLGEDAEVVATMLGRDLEFTGYQRPFELVTWPEGEKGHFVVLADYVTTADGTGLVHQSPAFGADDLAVCRAYELPVVSPIRGDGTFEADLPLVGGQFFKHADAALVQDLGARGVLFRHVAYEHAYPHCWRCHTPLMYYALPAWYVRTTAIKDALLRENEATRWVPESVQWGRYGDWLRNNVDWSLSRSRFWGTPLPIWRCRAEGCTGAACVESLAELGSLAGRDLSAMDPHRPYVDDVTLPCTECGEQMLREPYVIDVWYDSGAMPFAQWGYPHVEGSAERFAANYPAQFICEALDQTRGWFYTLMTIGTLVFDKSSYENVLCLGLILAEDGRKMSKHLGNVLEPISLMDEHGADALRWFMTCSPSPWLPRRVGPQGLNEITRKVLLTYWNTAAFQSLYGRIASFDAAAPVTPVAERPVLDRWALSVTNAMVAEVSAALEDFDTVRAGRALATTVDDLSNWYVRRSRRRFWDGDDEALATLHECLRLITLSAAPILPFITERVWQDLFADATGVESVHLAAWPLVDDSLVDPQMVEQVALVRRLVELGRAARSSAKVRTRQPLARALVAAPGWDQVGEELRAQVCAELNVRDLQPLSAAGELVDVVVKANFRSLGRRFGKQTPAVAAAISAADGLSLAAALATGNAQVEVTGLGLVDIADEDVVITETPREGWAVAREGETVALDLTLTDELRAAGLVREAVRLVQDARKSAGYDVTDRIHLQWATADESLAAVLAAHASEWAAEVLATSVLQVEELGEVEQVEQLEQLAHVEGAELAGVADHTSPAKFVATDTDLGLTVGTVLA